MDTGLIGALSTVLITTLPTNNMAIKILCNMIMISILAWINKTHPHMFDYIKILFKKNKQKGSIHFIAKEDENGGLKCSDGFKAWTNKYTQYIKNNINFMNIKEINIYQPWWDRKQENMILPDTNEKIEIDNNLIMKYWTSINTLKNPQQTEHHIIIEPIDEKKHNLFDENEQLISDYNINKKKKYNSKSHIFEMLNPTKSQNDPDIKLTWIEHQFESFRTMKHIWFEEKDNFLKRYYKFLNGKELAKKRGDQWTFSCILYGIPGCGKTSLLKALINLDKENDIISHLLIIPLGCIKHTNVFSKLMLDEHINGHYVPFSQRIYVFEDFDTYDCAKVLLKRSNLFNSIKNNSEENNDNKWKEKKKEEKIEEKEYDIENMSKDNLSLSSILNTLDGLIERNGQRVFWTTNCDITKLDPAFLRPGRMDMMVEFTKCTNEGIKYLIEIYYDTKIPKNMKLTINDYIITPSELKELCHRNNTISECIIKLNNYSKNI